MTGFQQGEPEDNISWIRPSTGNNYTVYENNNSWTTITGMTANSCEYCRGKNHSSPKACPRVRSITFYPDGSVKTIELRENW